MLRKILQRINHLIDQVELLIKLVQQLSAESKPIPVVNERFLTQKEAAWEIKKHPRTIRRYVFEGKLEAKDIDGYPYYRLSDLEKFKRP